jgi:hypothetical protein
MLKGVKVGSSRPASARRDIGSTMAITNCHCLPTSIVATLAFLVVVSPIPDLEQRHPFPDLIPIRIILGTRRTE